MLCIKIKIEIEIDNDKDMKIIWKHMKKIKKGEEGWIFLN
jgi:hypothetical protein